MSLRFKYATLGLLFVNVSIGGTLTHFAAPPVLMVAAPWHWTTPFMLATFGWGWHIEAGLAALRLILRGTFDRHPELQIVLGHWGEMLLFALDRIDGLSNVATHLQRRVAEYFQTNIHISTSGMLAPRLLRHALEYVSVERILLSGDYPFHQLDAVTITDFLQTLPDCEDQQKIAYVNAESLYGLSQLPPGADGQIAQVQEQS